MPQRGERVSGQPAFVLHSYPYKETSLIVDMFTRDFGRVGLVAKGAKRPFSKLRGVLQTFQPLQAGWSGKSELRTLIDAEWVGGMLPLEKTALLCGFYLNELLVKLLARDDPHPGPVRPLRGSTLNQLAHNEPAPIVLRKFERALLKETGRGRRLHALHQHPRASRAGRASTWSIPSVAHAPGAANRTPGRWSAGKTLLDMEREDYSDPLTQAQSKAADALFAGAPPGRIAPLNTRQILIDLTQL